MVYSTNSCTNMADRYGYLVVSYVSNLNGMSEGP